MKPSEQVAVRIPGDLLDEIDALVARGTYPSRAAVIRAGAEALTRLERGIAIDSAIAAGYGRLPPSSDEDAAAVMSLHRAILEEPW